MGRLGKLLSFFRTTRHGKPISDAKVDAGGGYNLTPEHFAPAGDDAHPMPGDYAALLPILATGRHVTVAYADPNNSQLAEEGEKRIYARDSSGAHVVHLWLKNDGSAVLTNGLGSIELEAGGDVVINGVTIDTAGNVTSPASVAAPSIVADGKELAGHDHNITSGSSAPGPTGPNNP